MVGELRGERRVFGETAQLLHGDLANPGLGIVHGGENLFFRGGAANFSQSFQRFDADAPERIVLRGVAEGGDDIGIVFHDGRARRRRRRGRGRFRRFSIDRSARPASFLKSRVFRMLSPLSNSTICGALSAGSVKVSSALLTWIVEVLRPLAVGDFDFDGHVEQVHHAFDFLRLLDVQFYLVRGVVVGVADFILRRAGPPDPLVEEMVNVGGGGMVNRFFQVGGDDVLSAICFEVVMQAAEKIVVAEFGAQHFQHPAAFVVDVAGVFDAVGRNCA